jgi:putative transcriptional regulator
MAESYAGKLLIATPKLEDPNFRRTVVLILAHDEAGAFGVVLNRPLPAAIGDYLPTWEGQVVAPPVIFQGGPVEPTRALGLGRCRDGEAPPYWSPVAGAVGLLDLNEGPAELGSGLAEARVYIGYAGWGAGQLEREVSETGWFVVPVRNEDVFTREPELLWRNVLQRQAGQLAMYAFYPTNPRAN